MEYWQYKKCFYKKKTKYSGTTCSVYYAPENLGSNNVKTCIAILISIPRDKKCPFTG